MPAHVTIADYGARTTVICEECHLQQSHDRWKPATAAAHAHNDTVHAFPPELDLDTDQETA